MFWIALISAASAAPLEPVPPADIRIVGRVVGEAFFDSGIASTYQAGAIAGGVGLVAPLTGNLYVDIEVAYRRLGDEDRSLDLLPMSALAVWRFGDLPTHGFAGIGPSGTGFAETGENPGGKFGLEIRTGMRIDTGWVVPTMAPNPNPLRGVDIELSAGRRFGLPGDGPGFDLDAWRASMGVGLRF